MIEEPRQLSLFDRIAGTGFQGPKRGAKWLNSPSATYRGTFSEISRHIPRFDRQPFTLAQPDGAPVRINERLDTIVRKPFGDDPAYIPVGVVSKNYALIDHIAVVEAAAKALDSAKIDPTTVAVELTVTEYGERMRLSVYLPDRFSFDPGDNNQIAMRLECVNSVDTSVRFRAVLGWFRYICSNGVVVGITQSDLHRRHIGDFNIEDIGKVLQKGIANADEEKENLKGWVKLRVTPERVASWIESNVRKEWGFKAATRTYHILRTGYDVQIAATYKDHTPTTIPVRRRIRVPGATPKAQSAFDISQALAWLAKERNDIMEQFEWRERIPDLMKALIN
jgi:hypothetical protein